MNDGFYEAMIGEEKCGPFSMIDLKRMAFERQIDEFTPVKKMSASIWSTWGGIEQANRPGAAIYDHRAAAHPHPMMARSEKSRGVYIILGLLLGGMGAHNFYAGHYGRGAAQFGLSTVFVVLSLAIGLPLFLMMGAWVLVELFVTDQDAEGRPLAR